MAVENTTAACVEGPAEPDAQPAAAPAEPGAVRALDADLAGRARDGDERAFEAIVRRYQRPLFYLALRYVKSEADAADVAQRAFLRAYRRLGSLRSNASLRTWLYRIAINLSLNHIRDRREEARDIADDSLVSMPVGDARLVAGEESAALRAAIAELPPKQRTVLELRIYDELPFREVAALADCTENAAKVNFHHAVNKLKSILGSTTTKDSR